jgi:transposase
MNDNTKYVGLDVSKEKIAVAVADEGRGEPRYWGMVPNDLKAIRKVLGQIGQSEQLEVCYEAGPTGYGLYRQLLSLGIECTVVAPSLIPKRAGDRVKTDRRDAMRLAQLLRAGELVSVYVPTEEDEALRDLVRAREDAKEDQLRTKHRLTKLLLRYDIKPPKNMKRKWTKMYWEWLTGLKFKNRALQVAFQEYLHSLFEVEERIKRLEEEIHSQATESPKAPLIQALQTLRGVAEITATSLVAEIGTFSRFPHPRALMSYIGVVPSEASSGESRRQGNITKTGNYHARRLIIEASWSYRYKPALKGQLLKRQEGQPPEVQAISWKAQHRLHDKYFRMLGKGKSSGKAVTAVGRELAGFLWAIAREIEQTS